MRIAYSPDLGVFAVDHRVRATVESALDGFRAAGAVVEEVRIELDHRHRELADLWCGSSRRSTSTDSTCSRAMGIDLWGEHRDDLPPDYMEWIDAGQVLTAQDVLRDNAVRSEVFHALQAVFADHDVLVCPTIACLPPENSDDGMTAGPTEIEGEPINRLIGFCMTFFTNYTGHPAASIPAGFADGLPVGMQIIGRRQADADVLAASAALERERPWFDSYARLEGRSLEPVS